MAKTRLDRDERENPLYAELRRAIASGELPPGRRLATQRELQGRFALSVRAAEAALARLEGEGFIVRRRGAGTFVASAPPEASAGKGSRVSIQVLHTIEPADHAFCLPLLQGAEECLEAAGARYAFAPVARAEGLELIRRNKFQAGCFVWIYPNLYFEMDYPGAPLVLAGQDMEVLWKQPDGYDVVASDSLQGGALAGARFRELGAREVAVVGVRAPAGLALDPPLCPFTSQRLLGFQFGLGRKVGGDALVLVDGYSSFCGAEAATRLLRRKKLPDAIFAVSDDLALGLCHALFSHGVDVGREVRLIGYDGQHLDLGGKTRLTTVQAPMRALGLLAARCALERAAEPRYISRRLKLANQLFLGTTA